MICTGIGFDIHRLQPGRRLVLGGVTIASKSGLAGHSDADVLCHALMDALLGAMADGDIGQHFPDGDSQWKNADSLQLLQQVGRRLKQQGARILHVDSTVMAQIPRLAPYRQAMRGRLAAALGLRLTAVSVKATTLERLGALGRAEGIAALAVVTIDRQGPPVTAQPLLVAPEIAGARRRQTIF